MSTEQKLNEFAPATYEAWLELAARDLAGASFEKKLVKRVAGLSVRPLYTPADTAAAPERSLPGFAPYTRGTSTLGAVEMGWNVCSELADPAPAAAGRAASEELSGGAGSLLLRFDEALRAGCEAVGQDGIAVAQLSDLERVLEHVSIDKCALFLDAGAGALSAAAAWMALARKRAIPLAALAGSFGADPLSVLARTGRLPTSLEGGLKEAALLAVWASANAPSVRAITIDVCTYHEAAADAAAEIGIALASAAVYLRALTEAGLSVDAAAQQLLFRFPIGRDFFAEIAKLRAARFCFAKLIERCGGSETAQAMMIHAVSSRRTKTARDPWVNLLRATAESFAAAAAGVDVLTTLGFDVAIGPSDAFARRLARNTQHLLRDEAHLGRVVDPAGGSYYVEELTRGLAKLGWERLNRLEAKGGLDKCLVDGSLAAELERELNGEAQAVATRKTSITGVNEFPCVREEPVTRERADKAQLERAWQAARTEGKAALSALAAQPHAPFEGAIEALARGAALSDVRTASSAGTAASAPALERARLAAPFEALRDRADRYAAQHGQRPRVLLANLGPIPEHKARSMFAQNLFEAAGFEALTNDGFPTAEAATKAFTKSGAEVVALCSSDAVYETLATATAQALGQAGAKHVVLLGQPGDKEAAYRAAGVTDFAFMGMNVCEALGALLARVGAV